MDYEIHIYELSKGAYKKLNALNLSRDALKVFEAGIWGNNGWKRKHGLSIPSSDKVLSKVAHLKAVSIDFMRRAGTLPNDLSELFKNSGC